MANDIHKIKLLVLWDILCQNTDEEHALNTDEIVELLALRGINVSRKILVEDIKTLCAQGYEVLSYKKKYHYYYVVNRPLETAEVVMLADVINAAKITSAQKKELKSGVYDMNYIVNVVSKIIIETDGTVTVEMINGTKINNGEVGNANAGKKNRNENRCESDSRKAE